MADQRHDVFLSHNSTDKPAVEALARRLIELGIQPWLDIWNLIPGEPWQEAIEHALGQCAACAVFIGPSNAGPWQNEEMRVAIARRVDQRGSGFRVIPVLLPGAERGERSKLPSFLQTTTWVEFRATLDDEHAFHLLIAGIRGVAPGAGPGAAVYQGITPYRGLQVFDVADWPFFFGREALTEWLVNTLRSTPGARSENRFLGIIGPSGSGKSSLARAGLAATLDRGTIIDSQEWPIVIFKPGVDPLESLAIALSDIIGSSQDPQATLALIGALSDSERALHLRTRLALREAPPTRRLVLLIDQFEEVFTLCHNDQIRRALIENLLYAANVAQGQTVVLLTLRADFYGQCAAYPALAAALSEHQMLVGPMTQDELQQAIARPALLAGCEFEPGLVETLIDDVQGQPGALPLLQHALLELWNRREGRRLTHAAYQMIGGVEGALEQRAEAVYASFSTPEQAICRRIFLRLTQPGEGTEDTRRRASLQELLPTGGDSSALDEVVHTLAGTDARLVITEGSGERTEEQFVEVAHEALIRSWPRLRSWIDQNRAALRTQRRLTEAAREWESNQRDTSYLYQGARLAVAQEWATANKDDLNEIERAFLDASGSASTAARRRAQRRVQLTVGGMAVALVLISAFLGLALVQNNRITESARLDRGRFLVEQGQSIWEDNPLRGPINRLVFSANRAAKFFVVFYQDSTPAELRQLDDGMRIIALLGTINAVTFSPDPAAAYFIPHYADQKMPSELRRSADGMRIATFPAGIGTPVFSHDPAATYVVVSSSSPSILRELYRTADGVRIATLPDTITGVEFSRDPAATFFKTCYGQFDQRYCELYRSTDGVQVALRGPASDVIFSSGEPGTYFAVRYRDTKLPIEVRRISDGSLVTTLTSATAGVNFSPDPAATYLTVFDGDSGHVMPDYTQRGELRRSVDGTLVPLSGPIAQVIFSPDSNAAFFVVIYADTDKPAELRRTADASLITVLPDNGGQVFFSSDSAATYLAWVEQYGIGDGTAYPALLEKDKITELRRTVDGSRIATLSGSLGRIVFSPDDAAAMFVTYIDMNRQSSANVQVADIYLSASGISVASGEAIEDVTFLPDPSNPIFQVHYQGGRVDLWDRQGSPTPHRITDLGIGQLTDYTGRPTQLLDPQSRRGITEYSDGRAYLLDIEWLRALANLPGTLSPEERSSELVRLACQGPLASGLFDESQLTPYLGEQPAQACR